MTVNDNRCFHFLMYEIDTRINNETMDRYGIEKQSMVAMEELAELQKAFIAVNCRQLGKELLRKKGKQMG